MEKRYLRIYIILVLIITWSATWILFIDPNTAINSISLIMYIPGILALIIRLFQYKDKRSLYECFIRKINKRAMIFSILYPIIFIIICAVIAYVIGLGNFNDEVLFKGFIQLSDRRVLVVRNVVIFIVATIFTLPNALGEEYGWRGYLLPELAKIYGKTKATIVVGIVWGLFHVPAVFLLARLTGMSNPLLLCIVQALAAFTFSFPSAYCFYLSCNIVPVLFIHSAWNSINVMLLGNIYTNSYGIIKGNLMEINGEGILGVILGGVMILLFTKALKKYDKVKIN